MKILVTGGTVFASRYTAKYFAEKGNEVFVLNRGNYPQLPNVDHIKCDRHELGDALKPYRFDAVLDVTSYNAADVKALKEGLGDFDCYIMVSSSAVYPETLPQPFNESRQCGANSFWGDYGTNKIAAERYLIENVPNSYIIRPPYLYGEMNNLYREAFVFDCAEQDRAFYIPKDGKMKLQFFDIEDMCKFMDILIKKRPSQRVFNVGNSESTDICEWVRLCYSVLGKTPVLKYVDESVFQRNYFPFLDYEYTLDVTEQNKLLKETKPLSLGLAQSYEWYKNNRDKVRRKPLIEFIDENLG